MSEEESKACNVHTTETTSQVPVHDRDEFDFFKITGNGAKFKKFLTPVTESNMLLYIKIKSMERKKYRSS